MASLPSMASWPGRGLRTTPSPLERANSRSRPRPSSHSAASSRCSAYVRVARSRYLRCSFDSAGIVDPLLLHDHLDGIALRAIAVSQAVVDLLVRVDRPGSVTVLVERTLVCPPAVALKGHVTPIILQDGGDWKEREVSLRGVRASSPHRSPS